MPHRPPVVRRLLAALLRDRKAATAVEYGLILGIVVLAIMVAVIALGKQTQSIWGNVSEKVTVASGN